MFDTSNDQPGVLRVVVDRSRTRGFYDRISRFYDLLAGWSEAPARRRGLELLAVRPGERVLEIGCGTGHMLVEIARRVGPTGRGSGLDLSECMLERTRKALAKTGLGAQVDLQRGDATALPYRGGCMDAIFMSFTLELFDTPEIPRVLCECLRVLRPGGRIVVVGMSRAGSGGPTRRLMEWMHLHLPTLVDCRPIFVGGALDAAGFLLQATSRLRLFVPVEVVRGRKPYGQHGAKDPGSA